MRWFRFYDEVLNDPDVQRLPAKEFKRKFMAAMSGERNEFSRFLKPDCGRPTGAVWTSIRKVVFERDNFTCGYCGKRGGRLECDHIHPVSRGGLTILKNLLTACFACNRSKRAKTLEEWVR
jgi:hypothetical protein